MTAKSRSTLRRVERAAVLFYRRSIDPFVYYVDKEYGALIRACAAHAAAKAKRGKGC